jgi:hypothetical protein
VQNKHVKFTIVVEFFTWTLFRKYWKPIGTRADLIGLDSVGVHPLWLYSLTGLDSNLLVGTHPNCLTPFDITGFTESFLVLVFRGKRFHFWWGLLNERIGKWWFSAASQWPIYVLWYLGEWSQSDLTETVDFKKSQLIYLAQYIKIRWKQNIKLFNVEYPPDCPWTLPPGASAWALPLPPYSTGCSLFVLR